MKKTLHLLVDGLLLLTLTFAAKAADMRWESAGLRGGFGSENGDGAFHNYEAFAKVALPWRWNWGSDWGLQTGLDFSAGLLQRSGEGGFMGQAGPCFAIGSKSFPISLELGSNPTLLSRHHFKGKDLGSVFQFTSYAGLQAKLGEHVALGYRFQHTSNAGLGDPNPGLNMHVFSLAYRF
jgi:hypothetical protein